MTKAREPGTFEDAIIRIVDRIGWTSAAEAVGKVEKVVRNWSDPNMDRQPDLQEALALDAAYLQAGGGDPPLLSVYRLLLDREAQPAPDVAALAKATSTASREAGEAIAALVAATQPGASQTDNAIAVREVTEAMESLSTVLPMLGGKVTPIRGAA